MSAIKRVLVVGSAGRIGRATVAELQARGLTVRGLDRIPTPGLADSRVGNITDAATMQAVMVDVDTLIHLAATPDDADFLNELVPNNIVGAYHTLEAARLCGVRRLILASSGQVSHWQREAGPLPVRVDDPPSPYYWYAATKMFLESIGRSFHEKHGMSVIVVRLGWCPRTADHLQELRDTPIGPDVYLSPGDAGRFFACAVQAADVGFAIVYATSKPVKTNYTDLEPAMRLLGFEPQDTWPQGSEDIR